MHGVNGIYNSPPKFGAEAQEASGKDLVIRTVKMGGILSSSQDLMS